MATLSKSKAEKIARSLGECPQCQNLITAETERPVFDAMHCSLCGARRVPGLLARTVDFEEQGQEDFSRFHIREGAVAGVYLTETEHPAGYRIPKHAHQAPSLYLLLAGSLTEQFGREDAVRRADELIFTPSDRPHSNVFLGRGGRCLIIELGPAAALRLAECSGAPTDLKSFRGLPAWLARRLYDEFRSGDDVSALVIEGLILEMIGEICRLRPPQLRPQQKVRQAREFLDAVFAQSASLDDVARAVELHPVYLARIFRHTYRCSVGEYLRRLRIDFVCTQLSDADKPLAEIASAAGFCDQAHLTRTFHKLTGLTPGQYRARLRA